MHQLSDRGHDPPPWFLVTGPRAGCGKLRQPFGCVNSVPGAAGSGPADDLARAAASPGVRPRTGRPGCHAQRQVRMGPVGSGFACQGVALGLSAQESRRGRPNRAMTLLSKRVIARIRSPASVMTSMPLAWNTPVAGSRT